LYSLASIARVNYINEVVMGRIYWNSACEKTKSFTKFRLETSWKETIRKTEMQMGVRTDHGKAYR
jgi:hypothetical protein